MGTWIKAHDGEKFGDGGISENCKQCKDCIFQSDGTPYSNDYRKSSCAMFPFPDMKPLYVISNNGQCKHFELISRK